MLGQTWVRFEGQLRGKQSEKSRSAEDKRSTDDVGAGEDARPAKRNGSAPIGCPQIKEVPPALRHGAFSKLNVLPGENVDEFLKLYRSLVAELAPDGPLEHNAVWSASRALVVNHWNELYKKSRLSRIRRIS